MKSFLLLACLFFVMNAQADGPNKAKDEREYYSLTVWHFTDSAQGNTISNYLETKLVPYLHSKGFKNVGVFHTLATDTAADKKFVLFVPIHALSDLPHITTATGDDAYTSAGFKTPPYKRIEQIVLHAFPLAPKMHQPETLTSAKKDRVYELRSYESATEKIFANKVQMFNEGGEIDLFKRLNFNAVFYSEVVAGSHMPNLMYMTTFNNMADREAHWKSFGSDPFWKELSSKPEYQDNVQHIDITFLTPADYSDF